MGNIVEFKMKPQEPDSVYTCGCGGQLFYVVAPLKDEDRSAMHRCYSCKQLTDLYGLFWNAESDE